MSFVRRLAPTMLGLAFALASVAAATTQLTAQKISRLGEYSGYSEPIYDGSVRFSQYVTMRDGTKLAVDFIRPTRNGQLHTDPLPVIWTHHRYTRARVRNDTLYTILDWMPYLPRVMSHGYVVAAVDTRGGGASFRPVQSPRDGRRCRSRRCAPSRRPDSGRPAWPSGDRARPWR